MADVISHMSDEHSAERRYAKAEHTARMTSWGLWDTITTRRAKDGEKASRMEPNISEGLVIAEGAGRYLYCFGWRCFLDDDNYMNEGRVDGSSRI